MGQALKYEAAMEVQECIECGTPFAFTCWLDKQFRKNGKIFYCPLGHSQWYGESAADKLKKELEEERQRKVAALSRANSAESALATAKQEAERLKKRTQAGVCPCCNRTFQALARHLKTKHPEFTT